MKKIISIFLLFLLGLNSIGLYPIFKLIQLHAKEIAEHIIKQNCDLRDLVVFKDIHNNKEIVWEEENEEFSYNGKRYDIVKEKIENGKHLYYCYDDKKESAISNQIDALVSSQLSSDRHSEANVMMHLMIMLAQVFIPGTPYSFPSQFINDNSKPKDGFLSTDYPVCVIEIPLPPPWA